MTDHVRIAVPDVILPKENSGNGADSVIREETAGILSVIRIDSKNQNLSDGDFVLCTTSVSPLDRDKGRKALDPAKNALHFSVIFNENCAQSRASRAPQAESPIRACALLRGRSFFPITPRKGRIQDGSVFKRTRLFPYAVFYIPVGKSMNSVSTSKCSDTSRMTASTPGVSER